MKRVVRLTESQLKDLISSTVKKNKQINEYSEGFMSKVIERFKNEATSEIEDYVMRFKEISSNLKNKDLNMYSWEELKQVVDSYTNKKYRDNLSYVKKNPDRYKTGNPYDEKKSMTSSEDIHKMLNSYDMLDKNLFKNRNK
jgi:hypothetical protein